MSRRSPGAAAADWVVAIKAARARAVMSVFMDSFHPVTDHRPSVRAAAHRPLGRCLRNEASHRRCRGAVMQVTLRDDSETIQDNPMKSMVHTISPSDRDANQKFRSAVVTAAPEVLSRLTDSRAIKCLRDHLLLSVFR